MCRRLPLGGDKSIAFQYKTSRSTVKIKLYPEILKNCYTSKLLKYIEKQNE